jgi:hypothetical protein
MALLKASSALAIDMASAAELAGAEAGAEASILQSVIDSDTVHGPVWFAMLSSLRVMAVGGGGGCCKRDGK